MAKLTKEERKSIRQQLAPTGLVMDMAPTRGLILRLLDELDEMERESTATYEATAELVHSLRDRAEKAERERDKNAEAMMGWAQLERRARQSMRELERERDEARELAKELRDQYASSEYLRFKWEE